ncbi:MAG: PAS domain S-box protein [Acidobacteria bacterium]|nr:PAS domain S-box protein [Acidobacteriota bacterium]
MADRKNSDTFPDFQAVIIIVLALVYIGLAAFFNIFLRTGIIYTHFAYIPIVLASIKWERKGVFIALVLACSNLLFHLFRVGTSDFWDDLVRIFFFLVVSLCVGILSEKVRTGQQALRRSEAKYRHIFESSFSGIAVCRDDTILLANARLHEILGYPQPELIGCSLPKLVPEPDKPILQKGLAKLIRNKEYGSRFECRLIRKNGVVIWSDAVVTATQYEKTPAFLINVKDITGEKKSEEERRKLIEVSRQQQEQLVHSVRLAEMGEMAASVAHELNQPLTGIRTYADNAAYMIDESAGSLDEIRENLTLISKQVDRAKKIINQMRELTRKTDLSFEPLDINGSVREIVEFLKPQLELSRIEVLMNLSPDLPRIMGDQVRLEQVFLNLITNARRAMEESEERRLKIRSFLEDGVHGSVVIEIQDTGKGFAKDTGEKFFMPFYTTKKAGEGTGLGLPIALKIIEAHNGSIEASGIPGQGAKFVVKLPRRKEPGNLP